MPLLTGCFGSIFLQTWNGVKYDLNGAIVLNVKTDLILNFGI